MSQSDPLIVGAVAYSANMVPIWEGIKDYFADGDTPIDFVLYSNYERQVDCLLAGHIDIAWNTNVAWIRSQRRSGGRVRALAMRDTDLVFTSLFVARKGSGIDDLSAMRGKRIALGSRDSGQARILPVHYLAAAGIAESDATWVIFDSDVGKHGDTGRSDLDGLRAVLDDEADVAAVGINTWEALTAAGDDQVGDLEVVWESGHYNHCNFTALDTLDEQRAEAWVQHLLAMDWNDPDHRRILELEGLKEWKRAELSGYRSLEEAMDAQGVATSW